MYLARHARPSASCVSKDADEQQTVRASQIFRRHSTVETPIQNELAAWLRRGSRTAAWSRFSAPPTSKTGRQSRQCRSVVVESPSARGCLDSVWLAGLQPRRGWRCVLFTVWRNENGARMDRSVLITSRRCISCSIHAVDAHATTLDVKKALDVNRDSRQCTTTHRQNCQNST